MGSKSKSRNNSTSTNAAQMAALQKANPGATMDQMMGAQQGMQNNQLQNVMGVFNQMKNAGDEQMAQNPMQAVLAQMMGGMGPATKDDLNAATQMFDMSRFEPPEPQQPQVSPQQPQGYNVNPYLHPTVRINRYGRRF